MKRDLIIALAIGIAFVIPTEGVNLIHALLIAAGAMYVLTGTNPEHEKGARH